MKGLTLLAWRHLAHRRGQSLILVCCFAVTAFLPLASRALSHAWQRALVSRADATPIVVGARGNRYDLAFTALHFRSSAIASVPWPQLARIQSQTDGLAVGLHVGFQARGHAVVGTTREYFEQRGLRAGAGELPLVLGEAAIGANAARRLGLAPGDALFSEQEDTYDISKPQALRIRVSGVLASSGTPDDDAIFVDVKTCWILEGLVHGHESVPQDLDEAYVLARTDGSVTLSPAFLSEHEVTEENLETYHFHGEEDRLPLTAVLVFPASAKDGTMFKSRWNAAGEWQALEPRAVVDDLLAFVLRVRSLFDGLAWVLGGCTALLTALVLLLSMRVRAREFETLHRIGCSRFAVVRLYVLEMGLLGLAAAAIAGAGVFLAVAAAPRLLEWVTA